MEYTKGEWKSSYRHPYTVYASDGKRPPTTTPIAQMTAPDQVEMEANARLISATPDLYEELLVADEVICELCKRLNPQHENCTSCEGREGKLRAIAKAEGK